MADEALTAGAVARRLGVAVTTLRTWHQRYGLGPSHHVPGQHRRYTPEDMDRLQVMRRLTAQGVAPAEAAAWARRVPVPIDVSTPIPPAYPDGRRQTAPGDASLPPADRRQATPGDASLDPASRRQAAPGDASLDPANRRQAAPGDASLDPANRRQAAPGDADAEPSAHPDGRPGDADAQPSADATGRRSDADAEPPAYRRGDADAESSAYPAGRSRAVPGDADLEPSALMHPDPAWPLRSDRGRDPGHDDAGQPADYPGTPRYVSDAGHGGGVHADGATAQPGHPGEFSSTGEQSASWAGDGEGPEFGSSPLDRPGAAPDPRALRPTSASDHADPGDGAGPPRALHPASADQAGRFRPDADQGQETFSRLGEQAPALDMIWPEQHGRMFVARDGGGHAIRTGRAGPAARGLARAAMRLDGPALRDILEMTVTDRGVVAAWEEVIMPVLIGVGERYAATKRFIEVEHILSRGVTEVLGSVTRPPSSQIPQVLLAAADEEQHTLPLEALAAALAQAGVSSRLLGARVPAQAVADAIARTGPAVLVLWSQLPGTADPAQWSLILSGRHRPLLVAAAGPGWQPERLPGGVTLLGSLTEAVSLVAAVAAPADEAR